MKVIISHDIDHITAFEHMHDLILPKFFMRSSLETLLGTISWNEYNHRFQIFLKNKWHNLEELMAFDKTHSIPSTFFVGVAHGRGLRYSLQDAAFWIDRILREGFEAGVHGIVDDNYELLADEHKRFKDITGLAQFGIRMHYLKTCHETMGFLDKAGYMFDTSLFTFSAPFKAGNLWEFPLHIMDGYIMCNKRRWQNQTLCQAKDNTKIILDGLNKIKLKYITILFHDCYFSDSFSTWKEWYVWVVDYLKINKVVFISYADAVRELNSNDE
ncbi:MAG: hypothetical protein RDU01_02415 [Thermodesulfovibrionales bacterium]|nr:hypothetical protein [Thermodesulfovibrionales bacterium]